MFDSLSRIFFAVALVSLIFMAGLNYGRNLNKSFKHGLSLPASRIV